MKIRNVIKKPYIRIVIILSLLFFIWFWFKVYYNIALPGNGSKWNRNENGIWLDRRWMREPVDKLPDDELRQKLAAFKKRGIRYLFPHVCPMDEKGHLPEINHERVQSLLNISKEYDDFFVILPWVGGSIETVDLSNDDQRAVWVNEIKNLVEKYDFSGVNVNIEPLEHGDYQIHDWLKDLRKAIGEKRIISFCGIRPESHPRSDDNLGIWTSDDYEKISPLVDQITVMAYDSGRRLPLLYVHWNSRQFQNVMDAVKKGGKGKCKVLWGVPVYEDRAGYFDPNSENIRTSFHGIIMALKMGNINSNFLGVSIYSDWTIDEEEWKIYDKCWLGE